ncbi:sperm-egg fusion protein LLCFC1 [Trichechus inunguis]|uniref:Sperm-egg fusion protein LLCFC1 n=1 Tax=Trichechus manatus latirostris TaxID=127582 RepID=A0A2Y9DXN3_TRIMA|nr:sperm-egg fusion protein LLCFC1 [Trichechus manatus latirostris]
MTPLDPQLRRAMLLATILMLLLRVKEVRPQKGGPDPAENSQKDSMPSTDQDEEQFEERFVASSVGEMWQQLDMTQQEDEVAEAAAVRDHLFDLAFCLNLASIMVFL